MSLVEAAESAASTRFTVRAAVAHCMALGFTPPLGATLLTPRLKTGFALALQLLRGLPH